MPTAVPVKCRLCRGDHWSAKCPHKDLLEGKILNESRGEKGNFNVFLNKIKLEFLYYIDVGGASSGGAYKPPSMRAGAPQASSAPGKKMDFGGGRGPLNKGSL